MPYTLSTHKQKRNIAIQFASNTAVQGVCLTNIRTEAEKEFPVVTNYEILPRHSYDGHGLTFYMPSDIDYLISAVRRSGGKRAIVSVRQHRLYGNNIGQGEEASREQVISNMDAGLIYHTVFFKNGRYALGEKVIKCMLGNTDYIRTDGKRIASDSLGSMPAF